MANDQQDIPGCRRVSDLQRMWPTASRKEPDPPLPRAKGKILSDAERGACSPLGGQMIWPDDPRRRKR
jgi:hypothetical protein